MILSSKKLSIVATSVVLTLVFCKAMVAQTAPTREMPPDFKSDGCSLFPDGNYRACCVEHDKAYFFGGTKAARKTADRQLRGCVRAKGHRFLAPLMYFGVRVGGGAWLPTPFRWGFGKAQNSKRSK